MTAFSEATVLIVDDDPRVCDFVGRCLRGRGYRVLEAASGGAALALAREADCRIDLLLTDMVMPEMDGRELAGRFLDARSGAKVMFMSGYSRLGLPAGARFLQKPFTARTLLERVETALAGVCPREWPC